MIDEEKIRERDKKIKYWFVVIIMFAVAAFLLYGSIHYTIQEIVASNTYDTTTATIIYLERDYSNSEDSTTKKYTAYLSYEANGKTYTNVKYPELVVNIQEGDTIEITFEKSDPSKISISQPSKLLYIILLFVGSIIFVGLGIYFVHHKNSTEIVADIISDLDI